MQDSFQCCHAIPSVLSRSSRCYISLFDLLLSPFTRRFCSLNLLFPLLVFVVATSRRSLGVFALLTRYFRYQPLSLLANLTPPALVLTSCLASFPSPCPAFRHLQYSSLIRTASDGKLGEALGTRLQAICTHKLAQGRCEGGGSRGLERALACACLRTRGSHVRVCYLTCDLYCTSQKLKMVHTESNNIGTL